MCGIAGIILNQNQSSADLPSRLGRMREALHDLRDRITSFTF